MGVYAGLSILVAASVVALGCNAIVGAEEPVEVGANESISGDDMDPADEPPLLPQPLEHCGDGTVDQREECDDGNDTPNDGCTACMVDCGQPPEMKDLDPEMKDPDTLHCYRFYYENQAATWEAAKSTCVGWGGTLAAVNSSDEFNRIQNRVRVDTWIGGERKENGFEWITGEPWGYETWPEGGPGDTGACVLISAETLIFSNGACEEPRGFVCERPPAGVGL